MTSASIQPFPIPVTHPDKVYYPQAPFTKGEVLAYYRDIAPLMLPHLAGRPVTVKRYPDGVGAASFYEKRCPASHPAFVKTARVASTHHGAITFCVVDNLETLLWQANRAAIEFHPYLFLRKREDSPTQVVFDLDPGAPAGMAECLDIAMRVRELLNDLGLRSFVKTSGGKGLHLGVPVQDATFAQSKAFAHALANSLAQRFPDRVTARMAKAARVGRVFIDWSQNDHGKTTVCAYSLRARATPTVSTPLTWEEVESAAHRRHPELVFTATQVLQRRARFGDPYLPTLELRQRLPPLSC